MAPPLYSSFDGDYWKFCCFLPFRYNGYEEKSTRVRPRQTHRWLCSWNDQIRRWQQSKCDVFAFNCPGLAVPARCMATLFQKLCRGQDRTGKVQVDSGVCRSKPFPRNAVWWGNSPNSRFSLSFWWISLSFCVWHQNWHLSTLIKFWWSDLLLQICQGIQEEVLSRLLLNLPKQWEKLSERELEGLIHSHVLAIVPRTFLKPVTGLGQLESVRCFFFLASIYGSTVGSIKTFS